MTDSEEELEVPEIMRDALDQRSIYVGNVDYSVTHGMLQQHFNECGAVTRVTIPKDDNMAPKGFAYLQFETEEGMRSALGQDGTLLAGRQLKVKLKRVNQPGMGSITNRSGGARGRESRGKERVRTIIRYVYLQPDEQGRMSQPQSSESSQSSSKGSKHQRHRHRNR